MDIQEHVTSTLQKCHIARTPFPHFFARDVFPADFYSDLLAQVKKKDDFHFEKFANRQFADQIGDIPGLAFMQSKKFFKDMLHLFDVDLRDDFGGKKVQFMRDVRLIRDRQHYKIGPHTDVGYKVLSLLFYLPETDEYRDYGTALYVPRDGKFTCAGGPHYPFEPFKEVWRAPFVPNSCLGFWKTNKSFHGVPPIPIEFQRNVLLYNIYQATHSEEPDAQ